MRVGTVDVGQFFRLLDIPHHRAQALTVLAMVLGLAGTFAPWYSLDDLNGGLHEPYRGYGLSEWTEHYVDGTRVIVPYDSIACRCASAAGVFLLAQLLTWAGVLLAAIGVTLQVRGRLKGDQGVVVAAVAGLLLIGAPIALAVMLPSAFNHDGQRFEMYTPAPNWGSGFVGSNQSFPGQVLSWGPSWGFGLTLFGGLAALASLPLRRTGPKPVPTGAVPWPGQPQAGPTPPQAVGQGPVAPAPNQPQAPAPGGYR